MTPKYDLDEIKFATDGPTFEKAFNYLTQSYQGDTIILHK